VNPQAPISRSFTNHWMFEKFVTKIIFGFVGEAARPIDMDTIRLIKRAPLSTQEDVYKKLTESASKGYLSSYMYMGYVMGFTTDKNRFDFDKAEEIWKLGAKKGDPGCSYWLAQVILNRIKQVSKRKKKSLRYKQMMEEAIKLLKNASRRRFHEATYLLGVIGIRGDSSEYNNLYDRRETARKLFELAASEGHGPSSHALSLISNGRFHTIESLQLTRVPIAN